MSPVESSGSTFKDTDIGPMPAEWEVVRLGDLFDIQQGKALHRKHQQGISPYPFLRTSNVYWGKIDLSKVDEMDFSEAEVEKYSLQPNDLLVCEGGEIGRAALWQKQLRTYCYQNHLHRLRIASEDVHPAFYMYWMQAAFLLLNVYVGVGVKTTIANLSRSRLSRFLLPKPPLPEQRRIAHVLSTIQQAIAAQEDIIAAARETKRSLMHRLFTYGPGAEPAPTKETEIGEIPEHWEVVRVDDVFEIKLGKMLSKAARRGISPRLYLRNANVQWGYFDLDEVKEMDFAPDEMDVFRLRKDDILVCEGGEIGRTAIWEEQLPECYYQKALHRLRPKAPNILPKFFLYYMMLVFLIRQVSVVEGAKSTIAHLPVAKLRMVPVTLPPLGEQRQLVEQIGAVDSKIAAEEQRKAALQALFQSMLHQLMTGQVRVREAARLEPIASLHNGEGQG